MQVSDLLTEYYSSGDINEAAVSLQVGQEEVVKRKNKRLACRSVMRVDKQ